MNQWDHQRLFDRADAVCEHSNEQPPPPSVVREFSPLQISQNEPAVAVQDVMWKGDIAPESMRS